MAMKFLILISAVWALVSVCDAYVTVGGWKHSVSTLGNLKKHLVSRPLSLRLALKTSMKITESESASESAVPSTKVTDPEEITKKYGLEAGVFSALTSKDKEGGVDAKALLAKYGSAYLVTSISLAAVSFAICYVLVDSGVDVSALLAKVGIAADGKTETAGTVALAYAAHKAASPIRFPPTVALTPLTAKYLFNRKESTEDKPDEAQE
jgi:hypothetical protein